MKPYIQVFPLNVSANIFFFERDIFQKKPIHAIPLGIT
ncbi:MAG: hypothetical protein ACI8RA_003064, partial [Chlamydiales bacterium]